MQIHTTTRPSYAPQAKRPTLFQPKSAHAAATLLAIAVVQCVSGFTQAQDHPDAVPRQSDFTRVLNDPVENRFSGFRSSAVALDPTKLDIVNAVDAEPAAASYRPAMATRSQLVPDAGHRYDPLSDGSTPNRQTTTTSYRRPDLANSSQRTARNGDALVLFQLRRNLRRGLTGMSLTETTTAVLRPAASQPVVNRTVLFTHPASPFRLAR